MIFKDPWVLILIPLFGVLFVWQRSRQKDPTLRFSSTQLVQGLTPTWKTKFSIVPPVMRALAVVLLLIALAGPRSVLEQTLTSVEGIDIILAIDCSGSMAAEDFVVNGKRNNRLDIIKQVVEEFVQNRPSDRIGLVAFAGLAYTVCPLTLDHNWLVNNLNRITLHLIKDGTAIGSAINSSVLRLKKSDAKSRIIILLTDGVNNAGKTDPLMAAQAAKAMGIKVYTIGAGTKGYAPFPVENLFGQKFYQKILVEIDEALLKKIADLTNGKYFRATDTESLRNIYHEIDNLEKTKIEEQGFKQYKELFGYFLRAALLLLALEFILNHTLFLRIP